MKQTGRITKLLRMKGSQRVCNKKEFKEGVQAQKVRKMQSVPPTFHFKLCS